MNKKELNITVGSTIARCFKVIQINEGIVPAVMSEYASDALIIELDAMYENHSRVSIYTLKGPIPPAGKWPFITPSGFADFSVKKSWTSSKIQPPCGALAYKARTPNGTLCAIVQMMAATEKTFVLAMTSWFGFPLINHFHVGFKPGMMMRTEELLLDSLKLCE